MKAFTNVLEKPGTVQMGNMIRRISQLNELKSTIRNDPGIIFPCAKVTVMEMHQPQPCQGNTFFHKKDFLGGGGFSLVCVLFFSCQSCTNKQDGDLQAWLCVEKDHPCKGNNDF